jgi:hypothetical protein
MQRGLRITIAVAVAFGAVAAGAGTALASDNGPITIHDTPSGKHATQKADPKIKLPELGNTGNSLGG